MHKRIIVRLLRASGAGRLTEPCVYGHLNCSDTKGGACFDEHMLNLTDEELDLLSDGPITATQNRAAR